MRFRRIFKTIKFLTVLLCLTWLLFVLISVNKLTHNYVFDNIMLDTGHLVVSSRSSNDTFGSIFSSNVTKLYEHNETKSGVKVDTSKHLKNIDNSPKAIEKIPIGSAKSGPWTKTRTVAEFMLKAKQDDKFLNRILSQPYLHPKSKDILKRYFTGADYFFQTEFKNAFKEKLRKDFDVNSDVMVFLHIQKTGGMFLNDRFATQLKIPFKCNCVKNQTPCPCLNPNGNAWIYTSKFSGWPCGLHADWTQLHRCIPGQIDLTEKKTRSRRYFYFTQLRDPISRYMSEFYHQSVKGGHWQDAILGCGPGFSDWTDIRPCFLTENWKGVTFDNFMACQHNLATNRMTRMLADLNKSNCYRNYLKPDHMKKRAPLWVESAKENLQQMEYFGLMEKPEASDKLFSDTFKMQFKGAKTNTRSRRADIRMTEDQFLKLVKLVELDIHTYLFATDLFESRLHKK